MNDPVFLGSEGITSTNATYLSNLAQELIVKDKELLNSAIFYNSTIDIIGSTAEPKLQAVGKNNDYVREIPNILNRIARMNAFCAWMREAVKAKDNMLKEVESMSVDEWKPIPFTAQLTSYSIEDVLATLDIKERCEYLSLEAYAATLGKGIHPNGAFNTARRNAHNKAVSPVESEGYGKDTVLHSYTPSADLEVIDSTYEQLQNTHRQYEARLNAIKFKLQELLSQKNLQAKEAYEKEYAEYQDANSKRLIEFQAWRISEKQRISKLKIRIPNELKETFEYLSLVGSQGANS